MIKEALDYVFSRASEVAAAKSEDRKAKIVALPGDGRTVTIDRNGELEDYAVPPALRNHIVSSADDLIAAAQFWKDASRVIWIDGASLVLIIDDTDRRERVTLPLVESAVFKAVKACKAALSQPELIRLLRVEFRNATKAGETLAAVRRLKFRKSATGHGDIQHGNESMGQLVENEVTGADAIPESLIVNTNIYSNPGEDEKLFGIGMDLEIDAAAQKFILRPMPDEIERVTAAALQAIRERIEEHLEGVAVFYGKP